MIKVSHESPISMLERSRKYNDYCYALVHLFEINAEYYKFFKKSVEMGRHVLLDNSIFELGTAFDPDRFAYWIKELKPTEYVIPDSLENTRVTMGMAQSFIEKYCDLPGRKIGVVQGKSYEELLDCYHFLDRTINVDKIAISFDYSYYLKAFPHPNKWVSYMMGRVITLGRLLNDGVIAKHKPHHLLGVANPMEMKFYNHSDYSWIESVDTSSPVVHGLKGICYCDKIADWTKETTKLVDLLWSVPNNAQMLDIEFNIWMFKKYLGRNE